MVQRVNILVLCDVNTDDGEATPTTIALNGLTYEVDLCKTHLDEVEELLQPFFDQGRRVGRAKQSRRPRVTTRPIATAAPVDEKAYRAQVRAWAQAQGYEVGERGRIAEAIVDAYKQAHD